MVDRFFSVLNKVIETIELILGSIMILCVIIEILSRYILPFSTTWCEELARYCLVWGMMLGCAYGFGTRGHIIIDILIHSLSDKGKYWCELLSNIFTLIFCCLFIRLAVERYHSISKEYMVMARISLGYVYASVPVGFGLSILYVLRNIVSLLRRGVKKA